MTTNQPRVGGTITTVAQLNALPVGAVVVHDSDVDPPGIAVMQRSVHTGAWYLPAAIEPVEPLLPVTVLYLPSEPPSPFVECVADGGDLRGQGAEALTHNPDDPTAQTIRAALNDGSDQ